jgi:hypothetical protein
MFAWLGKLCTYQKFMKKAGRMGEGRADWTDGQSEVSNSPTFWKVMQEGGREASAI